MDGSTLASRSPDMAAMPQRPARPFSPWLDAWRRFRRHRLAVVSLVVLAAMILAILFAPLIWKVAINDIDFKARMQTPSKSMSLIATFQISGANRIARIIAARTTRL